MIAPPQAKPARRLTYRERVKAGAVQQQKPRQRIKPVSSKRQKENAEYSKLRREFLAEHPVCQFPGCSCRELDIHHKARRGKFLLRTDTWMAVCRQHHDKIEANPAWATERGYLMTPEQKRKANVASVALFSVDAERDFPWGPGDNDNYGNVCIKCKCCFRGHKRAMRCRKCREEAQARWNAMTIEEQQAHHAANMESAARYFEENVEALRARSDS